MKKIILMLFGIAWVWTLCGQTVTVSDNSDLQPIEGVNIYHSGDKTGVMTDRAGKADLSSFKNDDILIFSHVAYQSVRFRKSELAAMNYKIFLTDNIIKMDEVVFTESKSEKPKNEVLQKVEIISAKGINFNNPQNSGELLRQTGNVYVQTSQLGGGSPILRGFEANKVLLVVDGVRMNNAIYRSGHLQNVITIDPYMLDRTEVIFGPGSVIYGSDALGGVIHFYSKNPEFSKSDKSLVKSSAYLRYGSAANETGAGINLNIGLKKIAFLTTISYKDIGDLKAGQNINPFYGDWGKCLYYSKRINNKDSMVVNPDPYIQISTGYSQVDVMQKVMFKPNEKSDYLLNIQYSKSSDIPRYDRLTQMSGGKLKYAEWYYGPQERLLTSVTTRFSNKNTFYDKLSLIAAYQNIGEDRITRNFGKTARNHQEETVDVISFNADLEKRAGLKHVIRYGADAQFNSVKSEAYAENIETKVISYNIATRYPDQSNSYNTLAAYVFHDWKLSEKHIFSQGLRVSNTSLHSEYSDTMMKITKFSFNPVIDQSNTALTGSIGWIFLPVKDFKISLVGSSGFRSPNTDDVGKVNDSKSSDKLVIVPNPDLKSEYAYNAELSAYKIFSKTVQMEATGYYTFIKDAIVARPFQLNGTDSIVFNGALCAVQANQNAGDAFIYGFQGNLLAQVTQSFSIKSSLVYTYGRVREDTLVPLDHIPPLYGQTNFKLEVNKFKGEFYTVYSGWKKLEDYSPSGEDNLPNATAKGNPSWMTLNLRMAYQLNANVGLQAGVENLLDLHYRYFASGVSAPGRNFLLTIRGNF